MGTFVIVKRGQWAFQEPATDTPESIRDAVHRIVALHPTAFRDAVNLSASFVSLDASQRIIGDPRPLNLPELLAATA